MMTKYSPVKWNPYAGIQAQADTQIKVIDYNTVNIDGENYEFDSDSVQFPDIFAQTNGAILEAHRTNGVLYLTIRRFYTNNCEWDNGEFNEVYR